MKRIFTFSEMMSPSLPILLASLLLTTGFLKTLTVIRYEGQYFNQTSAYVQIAIAFIEFSFVTWLISGRSARKALLASFLLFVVFFNFSFSKALKGETTCGCIGGLKFDPWLMAGLDLFILFLLACTPTTASAAARYRSPLSILAGSILVCITIIAILKTLTIDPEKTHRELTSSQEAIVKSICQRMESNSKSMINWDIDYSVTRKDNTIKKFVHVETKLPSGAMVSYDRIPVFSEQMRIQIGNDDITIDYPTQEKKRYIYNGFTTELSLKKKICWIRPESAIEPALLGQGFDSASLDFRVPLFRPFDWYAAWEIESVEEIDQQVQVSGHSKRIPELQIRAIHDLSQGGLVTTLECRRKNGTYIEKAEATYQTDDSGIFLPKTISIYRWYDEELSEFTAATAANEFHFELMKRKFIPGRASTRLVVEKNYTVNFPMIKGQLPMSIASLAASTDLDTILQDQNSKLDDVFKPGSSKNNYVALAITNCILCGVFFLGRRKFPLFSV